MYANTVFDIFYIIVIQIENAFFNVAFSTYEFFLVRRDFLN